MSVDTLPSQPADSEILALVERWIDDLVAGDYERAFARTAHDPHYGWTPSLMESVIQGYGFPEPHQRGPFRVTERTEAEGRRRYEVERDETPPDVAVFVSYSLPLNGEWSDLTATFRVEEKNTHAELILEEIHVF